MTQMLFKGKPSLNTPYRQLVFEYNDERRPKVRLIGGEKAGHEHFKVVRITQVENFDDGLKIYDEWFRELQKEGWRPYTPGTVTRERDA